MQGRLEPRVFSDEIEREMGISLKSKYLPNPKSRERIFASPSFLFSSIIFTFLFLFIMSFTLSNSYSSTVMNDGDTLLFLSFVKNLSSCSLQVTNGLMLNAVNNTCLPFITGGQYEFYRDHPTGSLIPYVAADKLISLDILESRLVSITITLTYIIIMFRVIYKYWNVQLFPIIVVFTIPVLWYHSIILHIFVQTAIFSLINVYLFVKRKSRSVIEFIPVLTGFTISFFMDWASFVLAIIISIVLLIRREYLNFLILVFLSISSYFGIRKWLEIGSGKTGIHGGLGVFGEQNFSLSSITYATLQMGRSLGFGLILIFFGFFILFNERKKKDLSGIDAISLILFFQGLTFVYVFINWSSGHSYWCYFLIPTATIEGTRVFMWAKKKFSLKMFSFATCIILFSSIVYSGNWWFNDFVKNPITYERYFEFNHLPSELLKNEDLYSLNANIMNGQGFKARYELDSQINEYSEYNYGDGGFLITNSLADLEAIRTGSVFVMKGEPIFLNWFKWWVVKLP